MGERLTPGRAVADAQGEPDSPDGAAPGLSLTDQSSEQMPRVRFTRRRLVISVLFVVSAVALLYFVLPKLLGLRETWNRLQQGNVWWLVVAFVLEAISFVGYVLLVRAVFAERRDRIDWRVSYLITMASLAATRLLAAAGAGGIALTAWSLRRAGMPAGTVARRLVAFLVILYAVYMGTLVIDGLGLYLALWSEPAPFAITIVPAIFGAVVIVLFLVMALLPPDFDQRVARWTENTGQLGVAARRIAKAPAAAAAGVRDALSLVRSRDPSLLGALVWWGFDIATLWACFHAFGASPNKGVIVMAYFVGWLGNTLPLPGGVGGVEGGLIGAFSAFGVNVETAVVAVLAYRAFSFWLPTLPGGVAYFQLRRTVQRWRDGGEREPSAGMPSYT
ncbi:MAG TPA: lysylphosphatidylglycerol synthase transmembrane domain-containing protein [Solirubrobacteraceae bacterium]|nr:lysylphosphatidylglycerol synthase transmembrane domain-containing protein [Solirubrobacteraceae bacterium]